MTRSYDELAVEAYKYAMSTLLRLKDNHHLLKALERGGYKDDIGAVLALSEDDLDNLDYEDSTGNVVSVLRSDHNLIRILVAFNHIDGCQGPTHLTGRLDKG